MFVFAPSILNLPLLAHPAAGSHIRLLPRMPTAISAMAYVNGLPSRLFCTSECGTVYVADFVRPEDSYTAKQKLPQTALQVAFLPSDPFAICMCPGSTEAGAKGPRLVWYDMVSVDSVGACRAVETLEQLWIGLASWVCTYPVAISLHEHLPTPCRFTLHNTPAHNVGPSRTGRAEVCG